MAVKKSAKLRPNSKWLFPVLGVLLLLGIWWLRNRNGTQEENVVTPVVLDGTERKYLSETINLPVPTKSGRMSVEQALNNRRSRRELSDRALSLKQLSQILWAAQGVTVDWGGRTAPSAKEVYPLELYVVVNKVDGLESGVYHYIPGATKPIHQIGLIKSGDFSKQIEEAVVQSPAKGVPIVIVIAGNFGKMSAAFGKASDNNVFLEAGHSAQNVYLQVESLGLGTVAIGGFNEQKTKEVVSLPIDERVIYTLPIGYPQ